MSQNILLIFLLIVNIILIIVAIINKSITVRTEFSDYNKITRKEFPNEYWLEVIYYILIIWIFLSIFITAGNFFNFLVFYIFAISFLNLFFWIKSWILLAYKLDMFLIIILYRNYILFKSDNPEKFENILVVYSIILLITVFIILKNILHIF